MEFILKFYSIKYKESLSRLHDLDGKSIFKNYKNYWLELEVNDNLETYLIDEWQYKAILNMVEKEKILPDFGYIRTNSHSTVPTKHMNICLYNSDGVTNYYIYCVNNDAINWKQ